MLLLGEGGPKNIEEGLLWLERAREQEEYNAFRLLEDFYGNGFCEVPADAAKARLWRDRREAYELLNMLSNYRA